MLTTNRLVLIALAAVVAFGVWRFALPAEESASDAVGDAAVSALDARTDARFTAAETNLELQRRTTGTYAGAAMPGGATLVRADAGSYCVQVGPPGTVTHLAGPAGAAAPGPC